MVCRVRRGARGWGHTLVELLVAVVVGSLLLTAVVMAFVSSSQLLWWIGARTDVDSAAVLALDAFTTDLRQSAYVTMTIVDTPQPAIALRTEDPATTTLGGFEPCGWFTIYYYNVQAQTLVRKTWSGTNPSNELPDPFTVGSLNAAELQDVIAGTDGTEHIVARNVQGVTFVPSTFPIASVVNGIQLSLQISEAAVHGATCQRFVSSMVQPRNHP